MVQSERAAQEFVDDWNKNCAASSEIPDGAVSLFARFGAERHLACLQEATRLQCPECANGSQADFYEGSGFKHAIGSIREK